MKINTLIKTISLFILCSLNYKEALKAGAPTLPQEPVIQRAAPSAPNTIPEKKAESKSPSYPQGPMTPMTQEQILQFQQDIIKFKNLWLNRYKDLIFKLGPKKVANFIESYNSYLKGDNKDSINFDLLFAQRPYLINLIKPIFELPNREYISRVLVNDLNRLELQRKQ